MLKLKQKIAILLSFMMIFSSIPTTPITSWADDTLVATSSDAASSLTTNENFIYETPSAEDIPYWYSQLSDNKIFMMISRDGDTLYRTYGKFDETSETSEWYECDLNGNVNLNTIPVETLEEEITLAPYIWTSVTPTDEDFETLELKENEHITEEDTSFGHNYNGTSFSIWIATDELGNETYHFFGYPENVVSEKKISRWYECNDSGTIKDNILDNLMASMSKRTYEEPTYYHAYRNGNTLVIDYDIAYTNSGGDFYVSLLLNNAHNVDIGSYQYMSTTHRTNDSSAIAEKQNSAYDSNFLYCSMSSAWGTEKTILNPRVKYKNDAGQLRYKVAASKVTTTYTTRQDLAYQKADEDSDKGRHITAHIEIENPCSDLTGVGFVDTSWNTDHIRCYSGGNDDNANQEDGTGIVGPIVKDINDDYKNGNSGLTTITGAGKAGCTLTAANSILTSEKASTSFDGYPNSSTSQQTEYAKRQAAFESSVTWKWYRSTTANGTYSLVATKNGYSNNTYTTSNSDGGYYFKVEAICNGSASAYPIYLLDIDTYSANVLVEPSQFVVYYNANGGSNAMVPQTIQYKTSTALNANAFTRNNYYFAGWSTNPNATTATYADKANINITTPFTNDTVTLYAIWKYNNFTLTFKPGSSIGITGTESVMNCVFNTEYTYPSSMFTKTGHTFTGWSLQENATSGNVTHQPADTGKNTVEWNWQDGNPGCFTTNNWNLDIYAQWKANDYKVNFNLDGGKINNNSNITPIDVTYNTVIRSDSDFPSNPVKDHYIFKGWVLEDDSYLTNTYKMPANGITLKALWIRSDDDSNTNTDKNIGIAAQNYMLKTKDVATHNSSEAITKANAIAWNKLTGADVTIDTVDLSKIKDYTGDYDVTFTVTGQGENNADVSTTIKAFVRDNISTNGYMSANDFNYAIYKNKEKTEKNVNINNSSAKELSNLFVNYLLKNGTYVNIDDVIVDADMLNVINTKKNAGLVGTYPLTFSIEEDSVKKDEITINVTLSTFGSKPQTDPNNKTMIYANDFKYGIYLNSEERNADLTEAIIADRSHMFAYDRNAKRLDYTDVIFDADDMKILKDAQDNDIYGTYPLNLKTADGADLTISIELVSSESKQDPDDPNNKEKVFANDFKYAIFTDANKTEKNPLLTISRIKELAKISGTDYDGNEIAANDITLVGADTVITAQQNEATGKYKVTAINDKVSTVFYVTLTDASSPDIVNPHPGVDDDNLAKIYGNNFKYGIYVNDRNTKNPMLTVDSIKTLANLSAVDKLGRPISIADIHLSSANVSTIIEAQKNETIGIYPVTAVTDDGAIFKFYVELVTIESKDSDDVDDFSKITANDFSYAIYTNTNKTTRTPELTDAIVKELAKVSAKDKANVTVDLNNVILEGLDELIAAQKNDATGKYKVKAVYSYDTDKSVSAEFTVTLTDAASDDVKKSDGSKDENDLSKIYGNNFIYGIYTTDKNTKSDILTIDTIKTLAGLRAIDTLGRPVGFSDILLDESSVTSIINHQKNGEIGTYPCLATLNNKGKATFMFFITLTDVASKPSTGVDDYSRIFGNNFSYALYTADGIINPTLTNDTIKKLASVTGFNADNSPLNLSTVTVDATSLLQAQKDIKPGIYDVKFTDASGNYIIVEAKLTDIELNIDVFGKTDGSSIVTSRLEGSFRDLIFNYTMTPSEDAPMPAGTQKGVAKEVSVPSSKEAIPVDFGKLTYGVADTGKTYTYTITNTTDVKGYFSRDNQIYILSVAIALSEDGTKLSAIPTMTWKMSNGQTKEVELFPYVNRAYDGTGGDDKPNKTDPTESETTTAVETQPTTQPTNDGHISSGNGSGTSNKVGNVHVSYDDLERLYGPGKIVLCDDGVYRYLDENGIYHDIPQTGDESILFVPAMVGSLILLLVSLYLLLERKKKKI